MSVKLHVYYRWFWYRSSILFSLDIFGPLILFLASLSFTSKLSLTAYSRASVCVCVWSEWEREKKKWNERRKGRDKFVSSWNKWTELNILQLTNELCGELWPDDKTRHTISLLQPVSMKCILFRFLELRQLLLVGKSHRRCKCLIKCIIIIISNKGRRFFLTVSHTQITLKGS